jgi:hypothetical protein
MLLTSRADSNRSRMIESLGDGSFGMHDVLEGMSFLVHNNCLKNKVRVGGKDDWLVISDNKWSLELVNLVTDKRFHCHCSNCTTSSSMTNTLNMKWFVDTLSVVSFELCYDKHHLSREDT